ncbi:hypothetical protein JFL47_12655 [Haemophilus haemoglobinophilus]|nr:hypothetical protein [Canicola haemoglobinophilus]
MLQEVEPLHVMTIGHSGHIWAKPYGWLHDAFAKQAKHGWYPNHYEGAQTFKIPIGQSPHCLLITTMRVGLRAYSQDFLMPETYTGWTIPIASDVGEGRYSVGATIVEGNKVRIWGRNNISVHVCIIGFATY